MTQTDKQPSQQDLKNHVLKAGLFGGLLNGCLIVVILGIALGFGLWLDSAAGNVKRVYTLILVLASVPVTMVVVFLFSRWLSARMTPPSVETDPEQHDFLEDTDSGDN